MYKIFFGERYLLLTDNLDNTLPTDGFNAIYKYSTANELKQFVDKFIQRDELLSGCIYFHNLGVLWQQFNALFRCISAAGGVVENGNGEYLIIERLGVYDLPKGKAEQGETPEQTAIREVGEETGLTDISLGEHIVDTFHTYPLGDDVVLKCTYWYKMKIADSQSLIPQQEENITNAQWVAKTDIAKVLENTYSSIREVFRAMRE